MGSVSFERKIGQLRTILEISTKFHRNFRLLKHGAYDMLASVDHKEEDFDFDKIMEKAETLQYENKNENLFSKVMKFHRNFRLLSR